jgi:hypothetical protein
VKTRSARRSASPHFPVSNLFFPPCRLISLSMPFAGGGQAGDLRQKRSLCPRIYPGFFVSEVPFVGFDGGLTRRCGGRPGGMRDGLCMSSPARHKPRQHVADARGDQDGDKRLLLNASADGLR